MRKQYTRFYLVVIADYNDDDAHGIVHDNLYYWFDEHDLSIVEYDRVDVSPFNTVETGYILARRALNPLSPSRRQIFFVNTAPRMDDAGKRKTNEGEGFVWAELQNGKHVFGVNSGYSLSFVRPEIAALRALNVPDSPENIPLLVDALASAVPEGQAANIGVGQFRSGYVYPIIVAMALSGSTDAISPEFAALAGPPLDPAIIPEVPSGTVVFCDGYGNLKTSVSPADLQPHFGKFAVVACAGAEIIAHVRPAIFDVPLHHFSLAPGSTVFAYSEGARRQFVEVVLRGGHAAKALTRSGAGSAGKPPIAGDAVTWRLAEGDDFARLGYGDDGTPPRELLDVALRP